MSVKSIPSFGIVLLTTVLGLPGCDHDGSQSGVGPLAPNIRGGHELAPNARRIALAFNPADFVSNVDNPYFPLSPGTVYSYVEETEEGVETNDVEVTRDTKGILGVETTVVHDRVFLNGLLIEDTFDWYAQDKEGNVWYFGEDTKQYENGVLLGTAGSWEAGKNGASPGIIMLAHPKIGDTYQQEDSPGVVADRARVLRLTSSVSVPYGTFEGCLQTMDWTPLEPGVREFKYYAPGVGLVLEDSPRGGHQRVELTAVSRR